MGCFNETCALSHLPICYGDSIVVLFLSATEGTTGTETATGVSSRWTPVALPFVAKYNDYGWFEKVPHKEELFVNLLLDETAHRGCISPGETRRPEKDPLEELRESLHRSLYFRPLVPRSFPGARVNATPVNKIFVLKKVWDSLLQMKGMGLRGQEVTLASLKESVESLVNTGLLRRVSDDELLYGGSFDKYWTPLSPYDLQHNSLLYSHCLILISEYAFVGRTVKSLLRRTIPARRKATLVLERFAELLMMSILLDNTRRQWTPTSGAGSQETDFSRHLEFLRRCAVIAYNKEKKSLAEYPSADAVIRLAELGQALSGPVIPRRSC